MNESEGFVGTSRAAERSSAACVRLWALDVTCRLLRVRDIPRGRNRWFRVTLWLLDNRYRTARALRGPDYARRFDYVPF